MLETENVLVKRIAKRVLKDENNNWNKIMREYMVEIGMKNEDWETMSKDDIKKKVREYDNKRWNENLEEKTSLEVYKKYKKKVEESNCYDNSKDSELLFKARANVLVLEDLKRHKKENTDCKICDMREITGCGILFSFFS